MPLQAARHHWLNTIVGLLDQAFHLTEDEQVHVISITAKLLDYLDVPARAQPTTLPPPLALEVSAGFYTSLLSGPRAAGLVRPVRPVAATDSVVPVETWRASLLSLFTTSYPDLGPSERLAADKALNDLLCGIGVPDRAASFMPDDVVNAHHHLDD